MSGKVPPIEGNAAPQSDAASSATPSVEQLSALVMTWVGLSMKLSKSRPMTESLGMLNDLGLTMPQLVALHVMAFEGSITMTRLVERIGLSTSAVSHLLHRLVQAGLCERQDDPGDRRQKRIRLTREGRVVVGKIMRSRMADTNSSIEPLSDETRRRLAEVLTMIVDELNQKNAQQETASSSAGVPRAEPARPRSFEDVLNDAEDFGDDIADKAASFGDAIAERAASFGDAIADKAVEVAAAKAAKASEFFKSVKRETRKKNQE